MSLLDKRRVAVVALESDPQSGVSNLLEHEGFAVTAFATPAEALVSLAGRPPALFVAGLSSPALDGWQLCRMLRSPEHGAFNGTPILLVSSTLVGQEAIRVTRELGGDFLLSLPIETESFKKAVRKVLSQQPEQLRRVRHRPDTLPVLGAPEVSYRAVFSQMPEGCAVHEMIFDQEGKPQDCRFLAVNGAFEKIAGLRADDILGKTVLEVLPGTEAHWIENYGQVTLTGEPFRFKSYHAGLRKHFDVVAFRSRAGQFACIFSDVTERVERENEIGRLTRMHAVLSQINQSVVRADSRQALFDSVCAIAADFGHFRLSWIGLSDPATDTVGLVADAVHERGFPHAIRAAECGVVRTAIEEDRIVVCNVMSLEQSDADCHALAMQEGIESCAAFPIRCQGRVCGALCMHSCEEGFFRASEINLLDEAAMDISFALDKLEADARREDAVRAVRESEAEYRRLFEHMSEGFAHCRMIYTDGQPTDFEYLTVNPAFEALTGLRDVVGRRVTEVIPGIRETDAQLFELYGRVASGGKREKVEVFVEALRMWFSISVYSPARDYFVAIFDVITGRKETELALIESDRRFRGMLEAVDLAAFILDTDGRITFCNDCLLKALGWERDELIGQNWFDRCVPDADREQRRAQFFSTLDRAEMTIHHLSSVHARNGRERLFSWHQTLLRGPEGEVVGIATIGRDVTEQRMLEDQLRQSQKLESVGRLAGGIAHDFNNLLTVINGYSDLTLKRLDPRDPLHASLTEIRKAGGRAAELTRQLLAFSRKQIIDPKPLDLNRLITENRNMFGRLIGEDIELVTHLGPEPGLILADAGQFHQVLMNLIVNARDAMPSGGRLRIETTNAQLDQEFVKTHPGTHEGDYVLLTVADTGVGMDEATRQQIFEPFFTTKGEGAGTGLGLSTVYGIVQQGGGWIDVETATGEGTTFTIGLPRTTAASLPEKISPVPRAAARGTETVLLVEDQDDVRQLALKALQSNGYRVLEAKNGGEALMILDRHEGPLDLVLSDVVMPGMSGRELAERLKLTRPDLRVLYMSGYPNEVLAKRGIMEPGIDWIAKPFGPDELSTRVRAALGPLRARGRVLIADDDEAVRTLFASILSGVGYEVAQARDGEQALKMIGQQKFDVLVTDLVMPNQEGLETIRAIRKGKSALKIIAVTGAFSGGFLKVAELFGADATLMKPVSPEELLAAIEKSLG